MVMVQAEEGWTGEQLCKEDAGTVVHSKLFTFQQHLHSRTTACPSRDRIIILFSALRRPHLHTVSSSGPPSTGKIPANWCESIQVGPKLVMLPLKERLMDGTDSAWGETALGWRLTAAPSTFSGQEEGATVTRSFNQQIGPSGTQGKGFFLGPGYPGRLCWLHLSTSNLKRARP